MEGPVPGLTVGVIGGGQLGRMMAEAAAPLGIDVIVADPTPDCPAAVVARDQVVGAFDDPKTARVVAERSDVLTYEIELADPDALEAVREATGTPVHPDPETLRMTGDKLEEKRRLGDAGIPVTDYRRIDGRSDLEDAIEAFGYPVMLKARLGGYDGRGNVLVEGPDDVDRVIADDPTGLVAERFVPFDRELSVIGVRGDGSRDVYAAGENVHEAEILRESVVPARTDADTLDRAREVARAVLDEMDGRGVFGIELFEVEGDIVVNEIAPRPHNSGHWTIEGADTSQFEQHLRAVAGAPLGSTALRCSTAMANVLGDVVEPGVAGLRGVSRVLGTPGAHLHWYGKREVRPLRKMGHVTVVPTRGEDADGLLATAHDLAAGLTFVADDPGSDR